MIPDTCECCVRHAVHVKEFPSLSHVQCLITLSVPAVMSADCPGGVANARMAGSMNGWEEGEEEVVELGGLKEMGGAVVSVRMGLSVEIPG